MDNIDIEFKTCKAKAGAHLGACLRDGIVLATQQWQNVLIKHNKIHGSCAIGIFDQDREKSLKLISPQPIDKR